MLTSRLRIKALLPLLLVGLVSLASCFGSDDNTDQNCDNIDALLATARQTLENELYREFNDDAPDPDVPSDVDFSASRTAYLEAYECETSNLQARFGLAVTNLLALAVDTEVNAAFNEWDTYLDEHTPFEAETGKFRPLGIPLAFASGREAMGLPFDVVIHSQVLNVKAGLLKADPSISRVQNILSTIVMPTVQQSLEYLSLVAADDGFVFNLSPRMQGYEDDEIEERREIDQTDVLAMLAAGKLLRAACRVAVAYDVSFASYDAAGLLAALDQDNGTMFELRSGGAAHMQAVPGECIAAIDALDAAITSLLAETDNQDDDVIKIGPSDLDRDEVLDLQEDYLIDLRSGFNGPTTRVEDWDDDSDTPDAALTVDLKAFFNDPVDDFKALLPAYSVTTTDVPLHDETSGPQSMFGGDEYVQSDPIDFPVAGVYGADCSIEYSQFVITDSGCYGDSELFAEIDDALDDRVSVITALPDWGGYCYVWATFEDYVPAGSSTVTFQVEWNYTLEPEDDDEDETMVSIPVITWDATSYETWTDGFPDPTINGLFPGMTDVRDLFDLFEPEITDWEQESELDWTD